MNEIIQPRQFYRCPDCLSVVAVDGPPHYRAVCGICGGSLEHMGHVGRSGLYQTGLECPCDARCTSARGPNCDCKCKGRNHGTNLLVRVTRYLGELPEITPPGSHSKAMAIAKEYRAAMEVLNGEIARYAELRYRGEFLPYEDYSRLCLLRRVRGKVIKARCHKSRMKALRGVLPQLEPVAAVVQCSLF